ncbi:MAG: bifunctional (p)ppGpp synthetase/guanosine-3',5'-bis(diphosphate) 3'-pyrophosphohydrolase [Alphaproteobacteria bacterium]
MIQQIELVEKVKTYDPGADTDLLNRAYLFAMEAHKTQKRANGDPYFSHPVEVAYKLTDFKLDVSSIVTALLHDTVEDTDVTLEEINEKFGPEIGTLVDGVTKLSRLEGKSEHLKQAENFRKLLIAMSQDLRVLLVKLADRLHNMETLHHIKNKDKRQRIARETVEIYAALAERIGMRSIKEELQDRAFAELYPEARDSIIKRLSFLREEGQAEVDKAIEVIRDKLTEAGIQNVELSGREKKPFSIWKKMETKNVTFEQLSDIVAFRIVVDTIPDCYHALGIIHAQWHTIPGYFKDYISTPKPNGYQSLHTAIIGPNQQRVEIQIRTREMHDIAEYGLAAHWAYKQGGKPKDGKQFRWIRELLQILEKSDNPEEFLEDTKMEMYQDQVFCFTPKGDVLAFPRGATPVDFAYAVHSRVGDTCVGAKINGRIVPLRTQLKNGDQVDIITSKTQTPSPSWERFVITGKARAEIRKYMRTQQRSEYIALGRAVLTKTFKQEGEDFNEKLLEPHLPHFNKKEVEDLLSDVGEGLISRQQVAEIALGLKKTADSKSKSPSMLSSLSNPFRKKKTDNNAMPIRGLVPGMALHYAGCCHPIPGDRIVGIVTTGKGITIHTLECETLENYSDSPERWIDVAWERDNPENRHVGRIRAHVSHEPSALATVTNIIAKENGNISNLKITNRSSDFFEILLDIEVKDIRHLNNIIAGLRSKEVVQSVERYQT